MSSDRTAAGAQYLSLAACVALCLLGPLSGIAQSGLSPVMPQISAHFAGDPNAGVLVRAMVSGLSAAMIFGALVSGFLSERIGQLRLLLICLVLYGLAGTVGYVLDSLYLIVASRILLGVVNAAAGVLAMALITTRVTADARDRWLGFYIVCGTIGTVLGMIVVGIIAKSDWRNAFLLYLLALPIALFIALTFSPSAKGDEATVAKNAAQGAFMPWGKILFGLLCGAIAATTFMYLPFHLAAIGQGKPEEVASAIVSATVAGGATSFLFGWIRKYFSAIQVFFGSLAVCGAGLLMTVTTTSHAFVVAGMAIYGAGFGVVTPNLFSACAAATDPELRPRMLGLVRAGFYAGPLVAQVFLEMVLNHWGSAAAVAAIAAMCLAGAVLAVAFRSVFTPVEAIPAHG